MATRRPKVGVVIAGAGRGTRLGRRVPKQFLRLGGETILERTVGIFEKIGETEAIVIVAPAAHLKRTKSLVKKFRKVVAVVPGGAHRQASVHSGLESFPEPPGIVLVHDAVRPFVTARTVRKVIVSARKYRAAIVGVRVTETIKEEAKDGFFLRTVPRERLWVAQTPQGFRFDLLLAAHRAAARGRYIGTDDASLVERIGTRVRIVEGEGGNLKITTLQDLEIAELRGKR